MVRTLRNNKGQSIVEFTILLPIILLIFMGIIEFGIMMNSYLTIRNASREGARAGIVGRSDLEIQALVTAVSPNLEQANLTVEITPSTVNRVPGNELNVNLIYKYQFTLPFISGVFNDVLELKAQTSMRIE